MHFLRINPPNNKWEEREREKERERKRKKEGRGRRERKKGKEKKGNKRLRNFERKVMGNNIKADGNKKKSGLIDEY